MNTQSNPSLPPQFPVTHTRRSPLIRATSSGLFLPVARGLLFLSLMSGPALADGVGNPFERPKVRGDNPVEFLECPSKPGKFYKPGHKHLCREDAPAPTQSRPEPEDC